MAAFTRTNGASQAIVGSLKTTYQLKAFIITVKDNSNTAIDLRSDDGVVEGNLEQLLREISPLMYFAADADTGVVHVIVDGHAVDAATLQIRVRNVFGGTANDSTVVEGTSITVA